MMDKKSHSLYVGAMNKVIKLNLTNIADNNHREAILLANSTSLDRCIWQGKEKMPDCQNHVRLIAFNGSNLFVCGTGAYNPTTYLLDIHSLRQIGRSERGMGLCAFDPFDNSTAVLVKSKNQQNDLVSIYSGAFADFSKAQPQIYRPSVYSKNGTLLNKYLRSALSSSKWLNEPQFVASFDAGEQVFFFLRELAVEYSNCGKKIYSRVARVCKNDKGGARLLINEWSTYLKARINCSLPGQYPYYFDEIQDVYSDDNKIFYALFTTNRNGVTASAICAYDWQDIQKVFNGPFKNQDNDKSIWLPVPDKHVPAIRPGNCSIKDSRSLPDNVLTFIKNTPLMHLSLPHMYSTPIYHKANVMMQKLVVAFNVSGHGDTVFFTASNQGKVYKIFQRPIRNNQPPSSVLSSVYSPFPHTQPIWSLKLHKNSLYLGTDTQVLQVNVETCDQYKKVDACINDPYCGWSNSDNNCLYNHPHNRNTRLITFKDINTNLPFEEAIEQILNDKLYDALTLNVSVGTSFRLKLNYKLCVHGPVTWKKDSVELCPGDEYLLAQDQSLILQNIHENHQGIYQAIDTHHKEVSHYIVNVRKGKAEIEKDWMLKFQEWCVLFEDYKKQRDKWTRDCQNGNADLNSNTINTIPRNHN